MSGPSGIFKNSSSPAAPSNCFFFASAATSLSGLIPKILATS